MAVMTPEAALLVVEAYCKRRVPEDIRDEMRVECSRRGNSITISEWRAPWRADLGPDWTELKLAQLRWDPSSGTWSLYSRGSDDRWHLHDRVGPAESVVALLLEVEDDPTNIFWG